MAKEKRTKNQIRREKAKLRRLNDVQKIHPEKDTAEADSTPSTNNVRDDPSPKDVIVEDIEISKDPQLLEQFSNVFERFQKKEAESENEIGDGIEDKRDETVISSSEYESDSDDESDDSDNNSKKLSKRQKRIQNKTPLALLKASTTKPQLVEWFDADAKDPFMLVALKSQLNTIQVPEHWSAKRDYLANRKGIERIPFQLPKFIRDTGIQDMRQPEELNLRQESRNKVQPKMGRLDIDYQKLHNAFFKFQEKPRTFGFGQVYFEGKEANDEYAEDISRIKPGIVSISLRKALEMPENTNVAPPWISIMAEIGKPPSYKNLVIPGLDIEYSNTGYKEKNYKQNPETYEYWGKLQDFEDEEEEDESEEEEVEVEENEEEEENSEVQEDLNTDQPVKVPISEIGRHTSKVSVEPSSDKISAPKPLFTVLNELKVDSNGDGVIQNDHEYNLKKQNVKDDPTTTTASESEPKKKFKF